MLYNKSGSYSINIRMKDLMQERWLKSYGLYIMKAIGILLPMFTKELLSPATQVQGLNMKKC